MASEAAGLDSLHGCPKHGNLVVQMHFPWMELATHAEKFVQQNSTPGVPARASAPMPTPGVVTGERAKPQSVGLDISLGLSVK